MKYNERPGKGDKKHSHDHKHELNKFNFYDGEPQYNLYKSKAKFS